jgi:hypothetical protein
MEMTTLSIDRPRSKAWWKELWVQVLFAMAAGNAVATIAIAKWEGALDGERRKRVLDGEVLPVARV